MAEFAVPEIMYAMYRYLYFYYLCSSLHDCGEFVQLVHYCIPRFLSNAWHIEGTQCMLLLGMNE